MALAISCCAQARTSTQGNTCQRFAGSEIRGLLAYLIGTTRIVSVALTFPLLEVVWCLLDGLYCNLFTALGVGAGQYLAVCPMSNDLACAVVVTEAPLLASVKLSSGLAQCYLNLISGVDGLNLC